MAKKLLCIVLSVAMLLGVFAVAASAGQYYDYTPEEAEAEVAEKLWYVDYEEDVDWKDAIDRRWLTGTKLYDGSAEEAAPQEVLEYNLFFWADEIIEAYNSAASNEDYWNLYNKMATPEITTFAYEEDGVIVEESDILYDYSYFYRDESKAEFTLDIQADTEYAKPGDVITVEVYATNNFLTSLVGGGIFYNKKLLTPLEVKFNTAADETWYEMGTQLDLANGNVDRRDDFWPEDMYTPENLETYGVSWMMAKANANLGLGNYNHGRQFNNELLFTATYTVNEDAPDGAEIEFFVCDSVYKSVEVGYSEWGDGENEACWKLYRVDYPGHTKETLDKMVDWNAFCDQTVTSNTEVVTVGEEPAPEVKGEVVDVYTPACYVGDTAVFDVEVTGAPEAIRFETADGAIFINREDATIRAFNGNEIWEVEVFISEQEFHFTVYANYGDLGVSDGYSSAVAAMIKQDLSIHSIEIPDMYPDAQNGGVITAGKHDIIIKTSTDVVKIQFYAEDGSTYTYTSWSGAGKVPYEDIDGERVWTINHAFGPYGTRSLVIRTRSESTFFAATDSTLDATVVY